MVNNEKDQLQKDAYQKTFETVADKYGTGACRFFHSSGQIMTKLHNLNGNESILDIACGTGAATIPIAKQLPTGKISAIDFSPLMLEQAKKKAEAENLANIDFRVCDMTALPFDDKQFDHANCAFGLFFVEDMVSLLSHIKQKVKPNGHVLISSFCANSFMPVGKLVFDLLRKYGLDIPETPTGWRRIAAPEELHELFSAAGLENITITRESLGYYTTPEGWWEVIWNAGFRGLVEQLGDRIDEFKKEHLAEVAQLTDEKGLWLEIDVHFTQGTRPST